MVPPRTAPPAPDGRPLAVFDLDRTLLEGRTILALGERFGVLDEVNSIWDEARATTELAAGRHESARIAALFAGAPAKEFEDVCARMPVRDGARDVVDALHARGFRVGVASASYDVATRATKRRLGLDLEAGARLEIVDGALTGRLLGPDHEGPCGQFVCKETVLTRWSQATGATFTLGVGDGANDRCLLEAATLGVAVEPAHARAKEVAHAVVAKLREIPALLPESIPGASTRSRTGS